LNGWQQPGAARPSNTLPPFKGAFVFILLQSKSALPS